MFFWITLYLSLSFSLSISLSLSLSLSLPLSFSLSLSLSLSLTLFSWSPVEVTVYQSSHLFVSIHICLMFASEIGHVVGLLVWFVVCLYLNVLFFKIKQDHVYPFNHGFDLWVEDLVPWAALGRLYCQKTALVFPPIFTNLLFRF